MRATTARWAMLGILVLSGACSHNSTTDPSLTSTTSTTTTAAAPTVTEQFNGTLPVGGFRFYSFNIAVNGTVNVTLNKVSGTGVPSTVQLGLGTGQPQGNDCTTAASVTANSSFAAPQQTGVYGPGVFCVRVFDVGNLFAPATFSITIAHP